MSLVLTIFLLVIVVTFSFNYTLGSLTVVDLDILYIKRIKNDSFVLFLTRHGEANI